MSHIIDENDVDAVAARRARDQGSQRKRSRASLHQQIGRLQAIGAIAEVSDPARALAVSDITATEAAALAVLWSRVRAVLFEARQEIERLLDQTKE